MTSSTITSYQFRYPRREENPFESKKRGGGRKILPPNVTSSITGSQSGKMIDPEHSKERVNWMVTCHLVDAHIQQLLNCQMKRGRTHLQGGRSSNGNESRHCDLIPATLDNKMRKTFEYITQETLMTPKTDRYLKARGMNTPERKHLRDISNTPHAVEAHIKSCFTPSKLSSSISRTHYEREKNRTVDSPSIANHYDTFLEKKIRPVVDSLFEQIDLEKLTPKESTRALINVLKTFYENSIQDLNTRNENLKLFFAYNKDVISFIEQSQSKSTISLNDFSIFLSQVNNLLEVKKKLLAHSEYAPRCREMQWFRQDYYWLEQLIKPLKSKKAVSIEDLYKTYQEMLPYLRNSHVDHLPILEKYQSYLDEANSQKKALSPYQKEGAIEELFLLHFGINEADHRRVPTSEELNEQIYDILKPTSYSPLKVASAPSFIEKHTIDTHFVCELFSSDISSDQIQKKRKI